MSSWSSNSASRAHFDIHAAQQIVKRTSQVRGELKTKARPIVEALFNLSDVPSADDRAALNELRSRVESLKTRGAFGYSVRRHLIARIITHKCPIGFCCSYGCL